MEKIVLLVFLLIITLTAVCLIVSLFSLDKLQKIGATRTPFAPFARCTFEAVGAGLLSWNHRLAAAFIQIVCFIFCLIWLLR